MGFLHFAIDFPIGDINEYFPGSTRDFGIITENSFDYGHSIETNSYVKNLHSLQ